MGRGGIAVAQLHNFRLAKGTNSPTHAHGGRNDATIVLTMKGWEQISGSSVECLSQEILWGSWTTMV